MGVATLSEKPFVENLRARASQQNVANLWSLAPNQSQTTSPQVLPLEQTKRETQRESFAPCLCFVSIISNFWRFFEVFSCKLWEALVCIDADFWKKNEGNTKYSFENSWRDLQDYTLFCTAPNSKIRMNFVKHFRFALLVSKYRCWLAFSSKIQRYWWNTFRKFSKFYRKDQNLIKSSRFSK